MGSLCSGYDGIALALETVLDTEMAWYSEVEPAACSVMGTHWPDVALTPRSNLLEWNHDNDR